MNEAAAPGQDQDAPGEPGTWKVLLGIACAACFGIAALATKVGDLAYLMGQSLFWALVVWAVINRTIMAKVEERRSLTFFLVFVSIYAGSIAGSAYFRAQAHKAGTSLAGVLESIIQDPGRPVGTAPAAKGEMGEAERWLRQFLGRIVEARSAYDRDLEAAHIADLGSLAGLHDPEVLRRRIGTSEKGLAIATAYQSRYMALYEEAKASIAALNVSADMKAGIRRGIEKTSPAELQAVLDLDREAMALMVEQFRFLLARYQDWDVRGEQVTFRRVQDMEAFNRRARRVQELARKGEAIRKAGFEKARQGTEILKAL